MTIFPQNAPTAEPLSFPTLEFPEPDLQAWPFPPALSGGSFPMSLEGAQHCLIETRTGATVEGELMALDLAARSVKFRTDADGAGVLLTLSRIRSVTLTTVIYLEENPSLERRVSRPSERSECSFRLDWVDAGQGSLTGMTAGYLCTADGLFLFPSNAGFASCQRMFVPKAAYRGFQADRVDPHAPPARGIARLDELIAAIDAQEKAPVLRIGQSLIDLGLLTQAQLDYALAEQRPDVPLGEMLVSAGTISRPDLLTALAHKMGYPFVDLKQFPIDEQVATLLPRETAKALCALPIAKSEGRLVVVVDRPSNLAKLRAIPQLVQMRMATVVAPADQIQKAISRMPLQDPWAANVPSML